MTEPQASVAAYWFGRPLPGSVTELAFHSVDAIPDGWAKWNGQWVQVAQADRYDAEHRLTLVMLEGD